MKQENKEIKKNEEMINELDVEKLDKVSGGSLVQGDPVALKLPLSEDDEPGGLKRFKNPM